MDHTSESPRGSLNVLIEGGHELSGEITIKGSKNAAMGIICASLLNRAPTRLSNVPRIEDVFRLLEVMRSIGVRSRWLPGNELEIVPPHDFDCASMDMRAAGQTRSVIMLIGALMHRVREFRIPRVGGCDFGQRGILPHVYGFEEFGVSIEPSRDGYHAIMNAPKVPRRPVVLYESSDTATENILMAAALTPATTTIKAASTNYMVRDMCYFLTELGVRIDGIGSSTLTVHGASEIRKEGVSYALAEDPIEAMTFIAAAVATNSSITVRRVPIEFIEVELLKLERMGVRCDISPIYKAGNGHTDLVDLTVHKHEGRLCALPDKLHPNVFPGLNIDNLPLFVPIAAVASGKTMVHDWVFEGRTAMYLPFRDLGVDIEVLDSHRICVTGCAPTGLKGADVRCPAGIRPAIALLIGMLAAPERSVLRDAYVISRGYEDSVGRFRQLGARLTLQRDHMNSLL